LGKKRKREAAAVRTYFFFVVFLPVFLAAFFVVFLAVFLAFFIAMSAVTPLGDKPK
jgi:hypothetical protein